MVYFLTIFTKFGLESWRDCEIAPTLLVCWDPLCSMRGSFIYRLCVSDIEYLLLLLRILLCLFCMVAVGVLHRIHRILILKKNFRDQLGQCLNFTDVETETGKRNFAVLFALPYAASP